MNTLPKTKHVNAIKLLNLNNEQLIQAVLDWEEMQYCEFKYEAGIAYAKRITDGDEIGYKMLIETRFFWQWWKNEWAKRDADFLQYYSSTANKSMLHDQYLFQHNIQRLKTDELMERKACSMVGYCIDEYNRKEIIK
jgi:phosphoribosylaminoimidazole-succinocarboxamide synthase